jgi:filamentous hemagglutinin family protein
MKTINNFHKRWKQSLVNFFVLGGTITLASWFVIESFSNYAWGQITSDGTVGSQVSSPSPGNFLINGGTTRGSNLFHSFSEFSIPSNGSAYFNNLLPIQNIITRVTGGSISNIDGVIRANGTANLFFLNPNGIVFGPNAQLNIGGSFLASTASSLNFADGTKFSANASQTKPLLTVSTPLGLQYGNNPGNIQVQGSFLQVEKGKTLALMGGNLQLNNAFLLAPGGRVELGGLSKFGIVKLNVDDNKLNLRFPNNIARSDVFVTNDSVIIVRADGGGKIKIYGQNLTIDNSIVTAGISGGLGFVGVQAGDIILDAKGEINIGNNSAVANVVSRGATGNSGNIYIKAKSFRLTDSSQLATIVFGEGRGNAGKIVVQAEDSVLLKGDGTFLSSSLDKEAVGQAGEINIKTRSLTLSDNAQIGAITFGQGNAGKILIQASDSVSLGGQLTGILSSVAPKAVGQGGEINIKTGSLSLVDSAAISATTWGQGDAGNITVKADKSIVLVNGQIQNTVQEGAIGQGGKINIQADLLSLSEGSFIDSSLVGKGNGGDLKVQVGSLSLTGDSVLSASTFGLGNAGNILVQANNSISMNNSNILTGVYSKAVGNGGEINIKANSLFLNSESFISSNTFGQGNSGNIRIQANDFVLLANTSGIISGVGSEAAGNGADISIQTKLLGLTQGSQLFASTFGKGTSGNIHVNASESVRLSGVSPDGFSSGLFTETEEGSEGRGGDIQVSTGNLYVSNGAVLNAITKTPFSGGNIKVNANNVELTNGGQILTTAFNSGNAGNIVINANNSVTLAGTDSTFDQRLAKFGLDVVDNDGPASGIFANTESDSLGNGGSIFISNPKTVIIRDGATVAVDSKGTGQGGIIDIQADSLTLNNKASISGETASNLGGNINLKVQDLLLMRNGSKISTTAGTAKAGGDGGNMNIDSLFIVAVPKENSDITANAYTGKGGKINITTQAIYGLEKRPRLTPFSDITASSEFGLNGTVQINTSGIDPSRGLNNLPVEPVTLEVAEGCQGERKPGAISFFNTGRGGLVPNPYESLSSSNLWDDVSSPTPKAANSTTSPQTIVEAQSWLVNEKGEVVLVAESPVTRSQVRCRLR